MSDFEDYRHLIPLAMTWLESVQKNCLDNGRALSTSELQDAASVGVQSPENIRMLMVKTVTQPEHPLLMQAAVEIGLTGDSFAGRTVGYGIEIVQGAIDRRLLRHEFRHVYQFEQAGSLQNFIVAYLVSVLSDGYQNSMYEKDARAFEQQDEDL